MILSTMSSLESLWSARGVLDGTSPFVSARCGLGMEGCGGCCKTVGDFACASGEGLLGSLSPSLTVDVVRSVTVGEVDVFRAGVFGVRGDLALLLSFVF